MWHCFQCDVDGHSMRKLKNIYFNQQIQSELSQPFLYCGLWSILKILFSLSILTEPTSKTKKNEGILALSELEIVSQQKEIFDEYLNCFDVSSSDESNETALLLKVLKSE